MRLETSLSSRDHQAALMAFYAGRLGDAGVLCESGIKCPQASLEERHRLRILLSKCRYYQGDFRTAIDLLEVSDGTGISAETGARLLAQRAFAYCRRCDFAAAQQALQQARRLAFGPETAALLAEVEICRAALLFYLGRYEEVEDCARFALGVGEDLNLRLIQGSGCAGLGKSAMYRGNVFDAIGWFERALGIYEGEAAFLYAEVMRSELGCCYFALGRDGEAKSYFTTALQASRSSGALASLHIDLANMGCLLLRQGEYTEALILFHEALGLANEQGDLFSASKWLENIALAYSYLHDLGKCVTFRKRSQELSDVVRERQRSAMQVPAV